MKITVDTNILVRAATDDDPVQGPIARRLMIEAELLAVPLPTLCEFCWVLDRVYRFGREDIARALRLLIAAGNVAIDRPSVEAGLALLDAGGDFADGVIAHTGRWLGGERFVSFDQQAVKRLTVLGEPAEVPA